VFLAYHPSPSGLEEPEGMALRLAEVSLTESGKVRRTTTVAAQLLSKDAALFPWNGASFGVFKEQRVLWYFDPGACVLVAYGIDDGHRETYTVPDWMGDVISLELSAEPDVPRLHIVAIVGNGSGAPSWRYVMFDARTSEWKEERFPACLSFHVAVSGSNVYVLSYSGRDRRVVLYRRSTDADLAQTGGGAHAATSTPWQRQTIGEKAFADDYVLVPADQSWPHVFACAKFMVRVQHLYEQDGVWKTEAITPERPFPDDLPLFFLPLSAVVDPAGQLHVAYFDPNAGTIQHLWLDDRAWDSEEVASVDFAGTMSMAVVAGRLVIAYVAPNALEVRLAWRDLPTEKAGEAESTVEEAGPPSGATVANVTNDPERCA